MLSSNQYTLVICLLLSLSSYQIVCVPLSPCPQYFSYIYDGQWFGVSRIHPQIYNHFRTDHIRLNISLALNRYMPNIQNLRLLDLLKAMPDTLQDIAMHKPILYRVSFPFQDVIPTLLRMHVNGVPICINHNVVNAVSKIELQQTFFLPTLQDGATMDYYDAGLNFDADDDNSEQFQPMHDIPLVPSPNVIQQRDDIKHSAANQQDGLAADTACGKYSMEFKYTQLMSGGDRISAGTWPWLVAIFRKELNANNLSLLCTGSLITNRIILTAAHCFYASTHSKIKTNEIVLAFGRHDLQDWSEKNMRLSNVNEIHIHPDYLSTQNQNVFDADVAVVIAAEFIDYNSVIRPICLWPDKVGSSINILGVNGTLVGWGQPFENLQSNTPRRLNLPIVETKHCFPSANVRRNQRIFCGGGEKRGHAPCNGDSGSGLAIWVNDAWYLRGIVSAALGDPILRRCDLNTFVIFTDILPFRHWINQFL